MSDSSDDVVVEKGPPRKLPSPKPPSAPNGPPPLQKASGGPPGPPPMPAIRRQAPGVRGSHQAPTSSTLKTGDSVGGRFFVERYLGSSGGGVSYLCNDKETQEPVVLKVLEMPFPGEARFAELQKKVGLASSINQDNLTAAIGVGRTEQGDIFVAMEFVEGATLSQIVAGRREEGRTLSLRDTFTVLAHICDALGEVHKRKICHGVLTPYNIYLNRNGRIKVGNLAVGQIEANYLHGRQEGPFVDSIYVAPEVAADPGKLSPGADLYSLGMIAAELLSPMGLPDERKQAHDMALDAIANYPPALFSLISSCLSRTPEQRPASVQQFREDFEEVARSAGAKISGPPPPGSLPVEPAVREPGEDEAAKDGLFDLFDLGELGAPADKAEEDRYLVQKSGLDYGPFTEEQILEQLYQDQINEHSLVLDRTTQERRRLQEMEVFREAVLEYIPKREERLRLEAEARAELQRKVKKGGVAFLVMGIVAGVITLLAMGWFWLQQPDPEPMPLEHAFASLDYRFSPPPSEFQAVAVDSSVMESIFNPNISQEEVARQVARARTRQQRARSTGGAGAAAGSGVQEIAEVDLTAAGGSTHHLTNQEINQVIMADFPAMRECILPEMRRNRSFRGVTVKFFIRPSGTTGGVQIKEANYQNSEVGQCLVRRFRGLTFPEHGAISNRGVEFPFHLR